MTAEIAEARLCPHRIARNASPLQDASGRRMDGVV